MSAGSKIEWTEATWNPVSGCTRASAGCDNCYAVTMTHRLEAMGQSKYAGLTVLNPKGDRHFNGVVRTDEASLMIPLRWKKPRRVFVNSMSDLFHKDVPFDFIDKVFAVMALCRQHTFQILTKRPERMAEYLAIPHFRDRVDKIIKRIAGENPSPFSRIDAVPLHNVWLGTSIENQDYIHRIDDLLKCPASILFLSIEPMLGPVTLPQQFLDFDYADDANIDCRHRWVIVGGESGHDARPMDLAWARSLRDQCKSSDVPFFFKQIDKKQAIPDDLMVRDFPGDKL